MNPVAPRRKIKLGTRSVESLDVPVMQAIAKSVAEGVGIALVIALLAACSINLMLLFVWLQPWR
jgi:hypothetical protein